MGFKIYRGKIDVTKIPKDNLFKGEKGTYLDCSIVVSDEEDQFGNTVSLSTGKNKEERIYLGNFKRYEPKIQQGQPEDDLPF